MAKIVRNVVSQEIVDTNTFTKEQWIEFIKQFCSPHHFKKAQQDMFPFEYLKQKAIDGYNLSQELSLKFESDKW